MAKKEITPESVWNEYETACNFKAGLNLYDNVRANENFYIGKQWEGVQSNGLPTPVFNFIKRIILYVVASTATDNLKMAASPLSSSGMAALGDLERLTDVVNAQFEALFEQNKLGKQTREFMRNAAVDGDACIYVWFDPDAETGQTAKGTIRTEILENTRVSFGNPTNRDVQSQPYLLISRRELLDEVKEQARAQGGAAEDILSDCDETGDRFDAMTDGKVTTITRFWKDGGTVRAIKTTKDAVVRSQWDTGMQLYPIVWMNWDYVQNCYHGQAAVTGLIPNQIFVNKMFAMTMISLMTTAYPKVVYDKTRIPGGTPGGKGHPGQRRRRDQRGPCHRPGGHLAPGEPVYRACHLPHQGVYGGHRRGPGRYQAGQHLRHHRLAESLLGAHGANQAEFLPVRRGFGAYLAGSDAGLLWGSLCGLETNRGREAGDALPGAGAGRQAAAHGV